MQSSRTMSASRNEAVKLREHAACFAVTINECTWGDHHLQGLGFKEKR
jgi:hypothetical protein